MKQLDAYVRVSRVAGREGDSFISPEEQRDKIQAWAEANRVEVVGWFEELDQSGGRIDRPQFQRILTRIEGGESEGIIVANRSRFARSLLGALQVIDRLDTVGGIFAAADGLDGSTPEGRLAINVLLSFAEFELERHRQQWRDAASRAVRDGVHISSRPPTGYRRQGCVCLLPSARTAKCNCEVRRSRLVPDTVKPEGAELTPAELVAEVFRRRVGGVSWQRLADYLKDSGVPMSKNGVIGIVKNPAYLGAARGPHQETNENAHQPLVPRDVWEAAQPGTGHTYRRDGSIASQGELAGLARCGGCGYRLSVMASTNPKSGLRETSYACKGKHSSGECPARAVIRTSLADAFVGEQSSHALLVGTHPAREYITAAWSSDSRYRETQAAVTAAREELRAFTESGLVSLLGQDEFRRNVEIRKERLKLARRQLAELPTPTDEKPLPVYEPDWSEWPIADRRRYYAQVIESVTIDKADPKRRRWQPAEERIEIRWVGQPEAERLQLPTLAECRELVKANREQTRAAAELWRAAFDEAEAAGRDPFQEAEAAAREFRARNRASPSAS